MTVHVTVGGFLFCIEWPRVYFYLMDGIFDKLYSGEDFERIGKQLIEDISQHLKRTTSGKNLKTIGWYNPEKGLDFWKAYAADGNENDFFRDIIKRSIHTHNPKYIGHQVAAAAPITVLTGMISSLLNNGMAVYEMGISSSAIEKVVTDSICIKIGYKNDFGGFLTSGGSLANLTALVSARNAGVSHDTWNLGNKKQLGIMVCEEAHYCVERAAKIMGLGEKGIIKIPASNNFSMDVSQLELYYEQAITEGIEVFAIIGSAPSTATGAYDDLEKISRFAREKNLWFHVDGAHGGAAIYSEKYKHLLKGIEHADSVVIDGHKMLLMPTITTALLFKNKQHMQNTFSQKAGYLFEGIPEEDWINSGKKTFECTKTMMCLHWYVLLKFYGEDLFDQYVTRQYDLSQEFAKMLDAHPSFELATLPQSNILCFRITDTTKSREELNNLNLATRQRLLEDGEYYMVQTTLNGIKYLRTTLMNPFTKTEHLNTLLDKIEHIANSINQ